MASDVTGVSQREWQVLFSPVAPKLALSTIEFQHILLLTSTGLLMEGLIQNSWVT